MRENERNYDSEESNYERFLTKTLKDILIEHFVPEYVSGYTSGYT
jgi:hypothetical protein